MIVQNPPDGRRGWRGVGAGSFLCRRRERVRRESVGGIGRSPNSRAGMEDSRSTAIASKGGDAVKQQ